MVDRKNAQQWLQDNYESKKSSITIIRIDESAELKGELVIDGYSVLEKVLLSYAKEINKITFVDCPNIKLVILDDNQITEIKGLDGLTNLQWLNVSKNKLEKVDVSKNVQLKRFDFHENPKNFRVDGIDKTELESLNTRDTLKVRDLF